MLSGELRDFVLRTIATELTNTIGDWQVSDGIVRGPGETQVLIGNGHANASPNHLDLGFVMDGDTTIWDCVTGIGNTREDALAKAVDVWLATTGATILEVFTRRGDFANHFAKDDPDGLPGFHLIHGPVIGWGLGPADDLQEWLVETLPLRALNLPLTGDGWHGIKLFFGGAGDTETVEVQINHEPNAAATASLRQLEWPRLDPPVFVRAFYLAHPD